jgi:nucleoid-associated protein YgaU
MTAAVIDQTRGTYRPTRRPTARGAARRPAARVAARRAATPRVFVIRRLVTAILFLGVVAVAIASFGVLHSQASSDASVVTATVVVGPGDTVWDIARPYAPAGVAPQAYVAQVLRYNDVQATAIQPGTVLQLPQP